MISATRIAKSVEFRKGNADFQRCPKYYTKLVFQKTKSPIAAITVTCLVSFFIFFPYHLFIIFSLSARISALYFFFLEFRIPL